MGQRSCFESFKFVFLHPGTFISEIFGKKHEPKGNIDPCDPNHTEIVKILHGEMIRYIRRHTGLCERVILTVLGAQIDYSQD